MQPLHSHPIAAHSIPAITAAASAALVSCGVCGVLKPEHFKAFTQLTTRSPITSDQRATTMRVQPFSQYLQPSLNHLAVDRLVTPEEFEQLGRIGASLSFTHVASGPMVRSSYHADQQAAGVI